MFETEWRSGVDSHLNGCAVNENKRAASSKSSMRKGDVNHCWDRDRDGDVELAAAPVAVIMSSLWRFVCHGHWPRSSPADRCHLPNWPPLTGDARSRPSGMAAKPSLHGTDTPPMHCRRNETVYLYSLPLSNRPSGPKVDLIFSRYMKKSNTVNKIKKYETEV